MQLTTNSRYLVFCYYYYHYSLLYIFHFFFAYLYKHKLCEKYFPLTRNKFCNPYFGKTLKSKILFASCYKIMKKTKQKNSISAFIIEKFYFAFKPITGDGVLSIYDCSITIFVKPKIRLMHFVKTIL